MTSSIKWTRTLFILIISGLALIIFPASATIFNESGSELSASDLYQITNTTASPQAPGPVIYFFDPDCESCQKAEEFLDVYLADHPDVLIEKHNLYNGTEETDKFNTFKSKYNRDTLYVPVMFIGSLGLEGSSDIKTNFDDMYRWYAGNTQIKTE